MQIVMFLEKNIFLQNKNCYYKKTEKFIYRLDREASIYRSNNMIFPYCLESDEQCNGSKILFQ